jgi:hypothetical protein
MTEFTFEQKKKLKDQIEKVRNKKDSFEILKIIQDNNESCKTRESNKKTLLFFHNFTNKTYHKLDDYITALKKKRKANSNKDSNLSDTMSDYKPYSADDFPSQNGFSPNLRFSNREKNIIKRKIYDSEINDDSDDIVYTKFDVSVTDSEKVL